MPKAHPLRGRIDILRKAYDKTYERWKEPHIKLLYPFVTAMNSKGEPSPTTVDRITRAISTFEPFLVHMTKVRPRHDDPVGALPDRMTSPTYSLIPSPDETLRLLQAALFREFREEIVQGGTDMANGCRLTDIDRQKGNLDWLAHMSVGRIGWLGTPGASLSRFKRGIWGPGETVIPECYHEATTLGVEWEGEKNSDIPPLPEDWEYRLRDPIDPELAWEVNKVHVLYRRSSDSSFELIQQVPLVGAPMEKE